MLAFKVRQFNTDYKLKFVSWGRGEAKGETLACLRVGDEKIQIVFKIFSHPAKCVLSSRTLKQAPEGAKEQV